MHERGFMIRSACAMDVNKYHFIMIPNRFIRYAESVEQQYNSCT